jgi:hypothetical protein
MSSGETRGKFTRSDGDKANDRASTAAASCVPQLRLAVREHLAKLRQS